MKKFSAVDIKAFRFLDTTKVIGDVATPGMFKTLWEAAKDTAIANMHQDTWTYEEAEGSQDFYTNQLTGLKYRSGVKSMGDISVNFTIGQYDYQDKVNVLGGSIIYDKTDKTKAVGWKRAKGVVEIYKAVLAQTRDGQYVLLPNVYIEAHEGNTDKAVGLVVKGTAIEPESNEISIEYWFDEDEVTSATAEALTAAVSAASLDDEE